MANDNNDLVPRETPTDLELFQVAQLIGVKELVEQQKRWERECSSKTS